MSIKIQDTVKVLEHLSLTPHDLSRRHTTKCYKMWHILVV